MQSGSLGIVSYGKTHRKGQLKEAVLFSDISCQGEPSSKGKGKKKKERKKKVPVEFGCLISSGQMVLPSRPLSLPFAEWKYRHLVQTPGKIHFCSPSLSMDLSES